MTIRVPRRASSAIFVWTLLFLFAVVPLNAANEVATPDAPTADWIAGDGSADSTGTTGSDEGNPTDIDQIIEVLLSWVAAIQAWGR